MKPLYLFVAAATIAAAVPAYAAENTITIGFTDSQTGKLNVDSKGQTRGYDYWRER